MEDTDYSLDDNDISLEQDEKDVGGARLEWLKMSQKGQVLRAALLFFHTVDQNTAQKVLKDAKRQNKNLPKEEVIKVAKAALEKRAADLGKTLETLTPSEKLDTSIAHFKSLRAHYAENLGYVVSLLGKDGPEADAVWKRLPEPKPYFTTLLLVYPTDNEGNLNVEAFKEQIKTKKFKIMPWRFSKRVYESVWKLNDGLRENGISLATQDLKLECKEPQFQNIDVGFAGAATWQKNPGVKQAVLDSVTASGLYDKLVPFRNMTTEQLKEKLGLSTGGGASDVSSSDFDDMLASV